MHTQPQFQENLDKEYQNLTNAIIVNHPSVIANKNKNKREKLPEIEVENIGIYIGEWRNGKRDGKGIFK